MVAEILKDEGYNVITANSYETAIEIRKIKILHYY